MNDFIVKLDEIFGKKAPQLPAKFRELIVKFSPYLVIIFLIFWLFSLFAFVTSMMLASALGYYSIQGSMMKIFFTLVLSIVVEVLQLIALPGLSKRTHKSWDLLFYSTLVWLLGMLVSFNLAGFVIGGLLSFYILFQVRSYYIGMATVSQPSQSPTSSQIPPSVPPTSA